MGKKEEGRKVEWKEGRLTHLENQDIKISPSGKGQQWMLNHWIQVVVEEVIHKISKYQFMYYLLQSVKTTFEIDVQ